MARVTVLPYDPAWKAAFDTIRQELEQGLGDLVCTIHHVGSTSVEGLAAKPIIDLDLVIRDRADLPAAAEKLAAMGYVHQGDLGIPDREAFGYRDKPHLWRHNLYVCPADSRELHRHLTFRDYLRAHPEAAAEYGAIKLEGARLHPEDIDGYMAHKAPCIRKLYALCGLE